MLECDPARAGAWPRLGDALAGGSLIEALAAHERALALVPGASPRWRRASRGRGEACFAATASELRIEE